MKTTAQITVCLIGVIVALYLAINTEHSKSDIIILKEKINRLETLKESINRLETQIESTGKSQANIIEQSHNTTKHFIQINEKSAALEANVAAISQRIANLSSEITNARAEKRASPAIITGSIFVRTQGGASVKLSGATIVLYPEDQYKLAATKLKDFMNSTEAIKSQGQLGMTDEESIMFREIMLWKASLKLAQESHTLNTISDSEGKFTIANVDPNGKYVLMALAELDIKTPVRGGIPVVYRDKWLWIREINKIENQQAISFYDANATMQFHTPSKAMKDILEK